MYEIMNAANRKFDFIIAGALARLDKLDERNGLRAPKKAVEERPFMPKQITSQY